MPGNLNREANGMYIKNSVNIQNTYNKMYTNVRFKTFKYHFKNIRNKTKIFDFFVLYLIHDYIMKVPAEQNISFNKM